MAQLYFRIHDCVVLSTIELYVLVTTSEYDRRQNTLDVRAKIYLP